MLSRGWNGPRGALTSHVNVTLYLQQGPASWWHLFEPAEGISTSCFAMLHEMLDTPRASKWGNKSLSPLKTPGEKELHSPWIQSISGVCGSVVMNQPWHPERQHSHPYGGLWLGTCRLHGKRGPKEL